jgi:hypothetical protein
MVIERHATLLISSRLHQIALADLKAAGEHNTAIQFIEAAHDDIAHSATSIFGVGIDSKVRTRSQCGWMNAVLIRDICRLFWRAICFFRALSKS